jgi:tetratricopeptide (TPR) repeat protein
VLYSTREGWWKIADFGLTSTATSKQLHTTSAARGKCSYRAPELLLGRKSQYNQKSDIWSLGCILYELVTGEKVFKHDFDVLRYASLQEQERGIALSMVSLPWAKQLWMRWLNKLLQVDPHKRPSALQTGEMIWQLISYGRNDDSEVLSTTEKIQAALKSENVLGSDLPTKPWMLRWDDVLSRRADQHEYTLRRYERLIETRRLLLGPKHPYTMWSMQCYAWGQLHYRSDEQTAELCKKIYDMKRAELGLEHCETMSIKCGLAWAYTRLKNIQHNEKGCALFQDILLDMQRVLGPEHPETLCCKSGLARALINIDNIKALRLFDEAISVQKQVLGKEHLDTLQSINRLANLQYIRGEYYEAYHLYKVAMEGLLETVGQDHPATLNSVIGLSYVCQKIGKADQMQPTLADALAWREKVVRIALGMSLFRELSSAGKKA